MVAGAFLAIVSRLNDLSKFTLGPLVGTDGITPERWPKAFACCSWYRKKWTPTSVSKGRQMLLDEWNAIPIRSLATTTTYTPCYQLHPSSY